MNLRKYAKNKPCLIRLPGCSFDSEQTVLCHLRTVSTGMGKKAPDLLGAWGCANCHDIVDGRRDIEGWTHTQIYAAFLEATIRTQEWLIKEEIVRW